MGSPHKAASNVFVVASLNKLLANSRVAYDFRRLDTYVGLVVIHRAI